jgi:hypothetical protein
MPPSGTAFSSPLRVGLLLDSLVQPQWICRIIDDIVSSPFSEISLLVLNDHTEEKAHFVKNLIDNRRQFLYLAYTKLDKFLSRVNPDAFEDGNVQELLPDCPMIRVDPRRTRFSDYFNKDSMSAIMGYDLDVAIRFGFRILRGHSLRIASYGVWSYHHTPGPLPVTHPIFNFNQKFLDPVLVINSAGR